MSLGSTSPQLKFFIPNRQVHMPFGWRRGICDISVIFPENKGPEVSSNIVPPLYCKKSCWRKHAEWKMTRETATEIGVSEDHWLQRHLVSPFFTKTFFQLSRLRCEISMSVIRGHSHKTSAKPGKTTKIGISRGFEDTFTWPWCQ